ncbi:gluconokinase SCDLUD_001946 [Saccharomycodes ludwigii]|uniref:gluconokinase n=1 Tax=Saccharomycodes ludwigii TaxID=36035 RepID=UPI001E84DF78|nr:hypothetical protein SCDLUD_001946 [Saccharomycodes ludwigii]KAH3902133.1 hypothetical protein SCDLUD_001946 [Saccharomycodes ludwigii]
MGTRQPLIIVLGGPAGTGKTTVAEDLTSYLTKISSDTTHKFQNLYENIEFLEGDSLHPPENIAKMAHGIPLTDADRWGWLEKVATRSVEVAEKCSLCIVTCSSLKLKYRDYIRNNDLAKKMGAKFFFILLYADKDVIRERLVKRKNHFMKADMLDSQYRDLELPNTDKERNCCVINIENKSREQITQEVYDEVEKDFL